MRKKLIVLTTILGLIAFSGVAAAQEHDESEEGGDTTFNYGYDEANGVFIWGSSPSDGDFDCTLENGSLRATYWDEGDGGLLVEDLIHLNEGGVAGDTVEFEPTEEGDPSLEYDPEGEDCQLTAGEVAGPQGQVNHGMFLKLFNSMFDGQARGCMVRHIAQSEDLGKGNQQVKVPGVEETEETEENGEFVEGSIDFETVMTDCVHGPDDDAQVEGASNGKGRPDRVTEKLAEKHGGDGSGQQGPPDHARGKGPNG